MSLLVYIRESDLNQLPLRSAGRVDFNEGVAFAMDDYTVFHSFLTEPLSPPSGSRIACKFVTIENEGEANLTSMRFPYDIYSEEMVLICIIMANSPYKCYLVHGKDKIAEGTCRMIPRRSDLYSRSKGLLELDSLSLKAVGIVGVGSGGSSIAVELAKAGVGHFVLVDFDRLELANVARHMCGINDLGRYKTFAVRDLILQKNPYANVATLQIDVNKERNRCAESVEKLDLLICASDNDRSRFFLNELALKYRKTVIFGRAITRAAGGDVLRVRPLVGPCYSCLYSQNIRAEGGDDEEISQREQARSLMPEYTSETEVAANVQVGLSSDIAPISNFMVKLALVELSRGLNVGIKSLEEDFVADFYIWANRRDNIYETWPKLEFGFNKPSILRWYGARVERDPKCLVCGLD